jgi:hypothetical protein
VVKGNALVLVPVNVITFFLPPGLPAEPKSMPLPETATDAVLLLELEDDEGLVAGGLEVAGVLEDWVVLVVALAQLFQVVTTQSEEEPVAELTLVVLVLVLVDEVVPAGTTQLLPD